MIVRLRAVLVLALACGGTVGAQSAYHTCIYEDPDTFPDSVIAACETLLQSPSLSQDDRAEAYWQRGTAHLAKGSQQNAIRDLSDALTLMPDNDILMRMLAWTHRRAGEHARAEALLTRSLKINDMWQGYLSRCVVRQDLGRASQALPDCREAYRRRPSEDSAFFLARALMETGAHADALRIIESVAATALDSARIRVIGLDILRTDGPEDRYQAARADAFRAFPDAARLDPHR